MFRLSQKNTLQEKCSGDHGSDGNDQENLETVALRQQCSINKVSEHWEDHSGNACDLSASYVIRVPDSTGKQNPKTWTSPDETSPMTNPGKKNAWSMLSSFLFIY